MSFSFYPSGLKVIFENRWSDPLNLFKVRPVSNNYNFNEIHTLTTDLGSNLIGTEINVTGRSISNASKLSVLPIDITSQTVSAAHLVCYIDGKLIFLATINDGQNLDLAAYSFISINPFLAFS